MLVCIHNYTNEVFTFKYIKKVFTQKNIQKHPEDINKTLKLSRCCVKTLHKMEIETKNRFWVLLMFRFKAYFFVASWEALLVLDETQRIL